MFFVFKASKIGKPTEINPNGLLYFIQGESEEEVRPKLPLSQETAWILIDSCERLSLERMISKSMGTFPSDNFQVHEEQINNV